MDFFPSSHKDLAPGIVRGWIFFPSSHEDLVPGGVRGWNFFPSSHKDLVPGGDTHDPECHEPQIGVPKMDSW